MRTPIMKRDRLGGSYSTVYIPATETDSPDECFYNGAWIADHVAPEHAEYIVRAVNSHEALLHAAKDLVNEYFSHGGPDTHQGCSEGAVCFVQQAVKVLEKAIAQAESK